MMNWYYDDKVYHADSAYLFHEIAAVRQTAEKARDNSLLAETEMMKLAYFFNRQTNRPALVQQVFNGIRKQLTLYGDDTAIARLEEQEARWNWQVVHNYELSFEHYYTALAWAKKLKYSPLDIANILYTISEKHYFFSDYANAAHFLKETLGLLNNDAFYLKIQSLNTLGLCYQQMNNLDSSDDYFKEAYRFAVDSKNEDWKAIASGNLGHNLFLRGKYTEAVPLLQLDVDKSVLRNDWSCASGSQLVLAEISLKQNNMAKADVQLMLARQYVYRSERYDKLKNLYPLLSKWYSAKGNAAMAAVFLDSAIFVKDSLAKSFNALKMVRAQQKNELLKHQAELNRIEGQRKVKTVERNALIALVIVLLAVALYIYINQKKKHQQQQEMAKLKLQEKENKLFMATNQLDEFAKSISEKNKLLETLQQQFGENSNNEALLQLQQSTILTDEEWEKFRLLFEKVHGGYIKRLKEKLPELSPAEIRFMVLAKLKFSNKEMAGTLGVSVQAIRVTWHRLRKKLELPEEGSLDELVNSI